MSTDWEHVYTTTWDDLVRFLDRKVWDPERARDLAQEAFLRGLRHEGEVRNARAWLFTVASNLARDEARGAARKRRHLTLLKSEEERVEPAVDTAEMERSEKRNAVRRALERLTERDREILLLWDAGLSYGEIAEQTGLSAGAIGTTLARARRRLVEAHAAGEEDSDVAHC